MLEHVGRPILSIFLPEKVINWVLPDWSHLLEQLKSENRLKSFNLYFDILKKDYSQLFYIGILGFALSFFTYKNKKGPAFIASIFLVVFGLHSFVFRDPHTPNYLCYVYPLFLISIASVIYFVFHRLTPYLLSEKLAAKPTIQASLVLLTFLTLFTFSPRDRIDKLITTKYHGVLADKALLHLSYSNWKEMREATKGLIKPGDVVISTSRTACDFYLQRNNTIHFRQRYYDTVLRQYVANKPTMEPNSAESFKDLIEIFKKNRRGWVFADYYFETALTDPRAKDFVIRNMKFHFNLGEEGDVKVFSWDHSIRSKEKNTVVEVVGKAPNKTASPIREFTMKVSNQENYLMEIEAEGIDTKNEAFVLLNKSMRFVFKPAKQKNKFDAHFKRQKYEFTLPANALKDGKNEIQFGYNTKVKDFPRGFAVYNIVFKKA